MSLTRSQIFTRARCFATCQSGAVATQAVFAILAVIALAVVLMFFAMGGGRAAPAPIVADPVDLAVAELMARPIARFDAVQTRVRLVRHLDPAQRSDAQLRNAHRIWVQRAADARYDDPVLARDMVAIIAKALAMRGVAPHPDA